MKSSETDNLNASVTDAAADRESRTTLSRRYVAPLLQRHEDLPAITAVQSCDFFSTAGCS